MFEKRRAGPKREWAEAKTTLARATARMVVRYGYGRKYHIPRLRATEPPARCPGTSA